MKSSCIISLLWTILSYAYTQKSNGREYSPSDYTNLEVKRSIDLQKKIISIDTSILIKSKNVDPLYSYRYAILKNTSESLVQISAKMKSPNGEEEVSNIKVSYLGYDDQYELYDIIFRTDPMNHEEERLIEVKEDYFVRLSFFPEKISIKEDQYVLFTDSTIFSSPYSTSNQVTTVTLPSDKITLIKYTQKKSIKSRERITYTFDNVIKPFTYEELYIHYENNNPFTVMNYAKKSFEISHWGNIAVMEEYQIENIGAKLEGEFSRIDYDDYGRFGGKNALRSLKARLPLRAWGLWYRDEIGNVSTSAASREWDDVKLVLRPRFPVLGGWKSNFDIGYNLPLKFHVSTNKEGTYMVNLTFGMPYEDLLAKKYKVKVVLPEGADDIQVFLPIDSKYTLDNEKVKGFLDLFGRPAITLELDNVYDIHQVYFQLKYTFSYWKLFFKPLILIFYFMLMFIALVVYFRSNLSLSSNMNKEKEKEKLD